MGDQPITTRIRDGFLTRLDQVSSAIKERMEPVAEMASEAKGAVSAHRLKPGAFYCTQDQYDAYFAKDASHGAEAPSHLYTMGPGGTLYVSAVPEANGEFNWQAASRKSGGLNIKAHDLAFGQHINGDPLVKLSADEQKKLGFDGKIDFGDQSITFRDKVTERVSAAVEQQPVLTFAVATAGVGAVVSRVFRGLKDKVGETVSKIGAFLGDAVSVAALAAAAGTFLYKAFKGAQVAREDNPYLQAQGRMDLVETRADEALRNTPIIGRLAAEPREVTAGMLNLPEAPIASPA